jgi:hypothetical protein
MKSRGYESVITTCSIDLGPLILGRNKTAVLTSKPLTSMPKIIRQENLYKQSWLPTTLKAIGAIALVVFVIFAFSPLPDILGRCAPEFLTASQNLNSLTPVERATLQKHSIGDLLSQDPQKADPAYSELDPILKKLLGAKSALYCEFLQARARRALASNQTAAAEKFLKESIDEYPSSAPKITKLTAINELAELLSKRDHEAALLLRREAVELSRTLAKENRDYDALHMQSLKNLAHEYQFLGQPASALAVVKLYSSESEKTDGVNSFPYGESLVEVGRAELALKHYPEAEKNLTAGLDLFHSLIAARPVRNQRKERTSIILAQGLLYQTYMIEGKLKPAENCVRKSMEMCVADARPNEANVVALSRVLRKEKRNAEAERVLEDALKSENSRESWVIEQELATIAAIKHDKKTDAR